MRGKCPSEAVVPCFDGLGTNGYRATARRMRRVERYLDHAPRDHVLASVEQWPQITACDHSPYVSQWLIRLLYQTGLRVSEAANAKAADVYPIRENRRR